MNKVILIGNVGKDPEVKTTPSGVQIAELSLATTKRYKGEEKTQWHSVVAFNKTAEIIEQYIHKGSKLAVEGEIDYNKYEKDGETKYFTKIIAHQIEFLDSKGSSNSKGSQSQNKSSEEALYNNKSNDSDDDDVPF